MSHICKSVKKKEEEKELENVPGAGAPSAAEVMR